MMKWNAWWLPLWLGAALSAVYFLPRTGEVANSAVKMVLPGSVDNWNFDQQSASKDERSTLPPDTEFRKALCYRPRPGERTVDGYLVCDRVDLSVVLSGSDLNGSIHRPERCMPAQGHTITDSRNVKLQLTNDRSFNAKRLRSVQTKPPAEKGGEPIKLNCITYYFFVGHDRVTNDHTQRTLIDMKDRLLRGMDQRWAYVSVSMCYGKPPWIGHDVSEDEADRKLRKFLTEFARIQIDWDQIKK